MPPAQAPATVRHRHQARDCASRNGSTGTDRACFPDFLTIDSVVGRRDEQRGINLNISYKRDIEQCCKQSSRTVDGGGQFPRSAQGNLGRSQDVHGQVERCPKLSSRFQELLPGVSRIDACPQDKVFTTTHNLAPTYQLGLHLFLETLLRNQIRPIQSNVLNVSLSLIRIERDGETVDRGLLKTTIDMLSDLREVSNDGMKGKGESVFKTWWEAEFLQDTKAYYTIEAELNLERLSCPEFLAKIEKRLAEETDRSASYLNSNTGNLLLSVLDHVLIENTLQSLIDHPNLGLSALLNEDRVQDLKRMYTVFGRVGAGRPALMRGIKAWLVEQGAKIVETASSGAGPSTSAKAATGEAPTNDMAEDEPAGSASPAEDKGKGRAVDLAAPKQPAAGTAAAANNVAIEWVHAVLELKDKMDKLWNEAFDKDRSVQNAINDVSALSGISWSILDIAF